MHVWNCSFPRSIFSKSLQCLTLLGKNHTRVAQPTLCPIHEASRLICLAKFLRGKVFTPPHHQLFFSSNFQEVNSSDLTKPCEPDTIHESGVNWVGRICLPRSSTEFLQRCKYQIHLPIRFSLTHKCHLQCEMDKGMSNALLSFIARPIHSIYDGREIFPHESRTWWSERDEIERNYQRIHYDDTMSPTPSSHFRIIFMTLIEKFTFNLIAARFVYWKIENWHWKTFYVHMRTGEASETFLSSDTISWNVTHHRSFCHSNSCESTWLWANCCI